jgi:cytochrome P450
VIADPPTDPDRRSPTSGEPDESGSSPVFRGDEAGLSGFFMDLAAPQPRYRTILDRAGVFSPTEGFVVAASRRAVDDVFRDPATFSSAGLVQLGNVRPLIPLGVDPPDHLKYRKILDPLFAPRRMDAIEDDVTARVNRFIDAFIRRGSCNFTTELAIPFPSAVFLGLMGLPWDELPTLLRLKDGIMRAGGPNTTAEERIRLQAQTGQEIYAYFDAILDDRAGQPRRDILSEFLRVEVDGDRLSREEVLDICFLFLIAGLDTVTDSLSCFFAYLSQHPAHRRQLVEQPNLIPAAVEELLRWETPVPGTARAAKAEALVDGYPIRAGSVVFASIGAANVDPAVFDDPDQVRFDRTENRHLAFGGGIHRCLGSHLARRELRVALREWHRRIPEYSLKPGIDLHYPPGLRLVENLELTWPTA